MKKQIILLTFAASLLAAETHAQSWSLTGNAGTTSTQFLGTSDNKPLRLRTNNVTRMTLSNTGRVGINNQAPKSRLDVFGGGSDTTAVILSTVKYTGPIDVPAIKGISIGTDSTGIGVEGNGNFLGLYGYGNNYGAYTQGFIGLRAESYVTGTTGFPTGIEGYTFGGAEGYAVFGDASGANQNFAVLGIATDTATVGGIRDYAGYFAGNVFGYRYFQLSDERFKKNIQPLGNVLDRIMKIQTATYNYKSAENPDMHLPAGLQTGFMAQNLKEQFPNAVSSTKLPTKVDHKTGKVQIAGGEAEVVNYNAMIPVLTKAIQEQQTMIQAKDQMIAALQQQMAALESRISRLEGAPSTEKKSLELNGASLDQNTPNPFNGSTMINYQLPENTYDAKIVITSINGQVVRDMPLNGKGKGQIQLHASELQSGSYMYSLFVNGQLIDTKALLLNK